MSSDIVIGYNKNDFFYVTAEENGHMPSDKKCTEILDPDNTFNYGEICKTANEEQKYVFNTDDNSSKCIERELCENKKKVNQIQVIQNNHSGSQEKYNDYTKLFQSTRLDTLNLGVGIAVLIYLIYRTRNINI